MYYHLLGAVVKTRRASVQSETGLDLLFLCLHVGLLVIDQLRGLGRHLQAIISKRRRVFERSNAMDT